MAAATPIPLEEYLSTSYEPDCDYVEGRLVDRNGGGRDHSYLQFLVGKLLEARGLLPFQELRVQVSTRRYRVPGVLAVRDMPRLRFLREPPYIAIEILSREDRASEIAEKLDDYLAFGIANIWVIDPRQRRVTFHTPSGSHPCIDVVATLDGKIAIRLEEIFGSMPPEAEDE